MKRIGLILQVIQAGVRLEVEKALDSSAALAKQMGVPDAEILDNYDKISRYFIG